ncbi:MAG: PEP-CTERM sorting domain-containing protein [Pirellulales bacterium]|nr:PEP-CTERM sorting domain-containing protein [Pirellulales bacterium]
MNNSRRILETVSLVILASLFSSHAVLGELPHAISIDGDFSDWADLPSHTDPAGVGGAGVTHGGQPDNHDTDGSLPLTYVDHPDIDLLEYKFTHDLENLYAYFRASGEIGRTSTSGGRYYVIVTIDVDNNDATGYELLEGGYYPTSDGYDMNMEVEYYNGAFNTGHYLNHGCLNETEYDQAVEDQKNGYVNVKAGTYDWYTQWVWFEDPNMVPEPGPEPDEGSYRLPPPDDDAIIQFVEDKGPVYQGIIEIELSADGHEAEMVAPFRGFMRDAYDNPIMDLGKIIDISFSLEADGKLATGSWASDTGDPIDNYTLDDPQPGDANLDWAVDVTDLGALAANYGMTGGTPGDPANWYKGDFDMDGDVDVSDLGTLAANYGTGTAGTSVPEPTGLSLLGLGVVVLLIRRRGK